jgi:general secretion pathway protein A
VGVTNAAAQLTSYETFFGFHEAPFSLAPNTRFRFESASHQAALSQVTYALQRREPIVVVTGEIGTGKTLLCRTVVEQLDRQTFLSVISDPMLGRDDLLKCMLQDFGIVSKDRTQPTPSRADLIQALNEFLVSLTPIGAHAVVVLDEAQHAQADVLEEIRLLSNRQDERGTMLQIMLVGQDNLGTLLTRPDLRQLRERISRYVRLDPLNVEEVSRYIEHRLAVAREPLTRPTTPGAWELERALAEWNAGPVATTFGSAAVGRVAELSQGIPRRINLLCDRALEYAFVAQSRFVDGEMVESAARSLQMAEPPRRLPVERPPPIEPPPQVFEPQAVFDAPTVLDVPTVLEAPPVLAAPPVLEAPPVFEAQTVFEPPPALEPPPEFEPSPEVDNIPAALESRTTRRRNAVVTAAAAVAAGVVAAGVAGWVAMRPAAKEPAEATAPPPVSTPRADAAPPPAPQTPAAAQAPDPGAARVSEPQPATPNQPRPADQSTDRFEIVVASFRTDARATAVASEIGAVVQPVRQRVANGWHQVLVGPFASRTLADDARQQLQRAGYGDSQIIPVER